MVPNPSSARPTMSKATPANRVQTVFVMRARQPSSCLLSLRLLRWIRIDSLPEIPPKIGIRDESRRTIAHNVRDVKRRRLTRSDSESQHCATQRERKKRRRIRGAV